MIITKSTLDNLYRPICAILARSRSENGEQVTSYVLLTYYTRQNRREIAQVGQKYGPLSVIDRLKGKCYL